MKTKELKTKTVFDFSNYPAIIEEITGISIKDSNRVEYYKKTCHPINKARDIEYLAYKIGDKQLEVAASGKSSVSCPLKPSDSAPLKHSTMPP